MNSKLLSAVAGLVLASTLPTSALEINIVEDSSTRFAFDLVWGAEMSPPLSVAVTGTYGSVSANDAAYGGLIGTAEEVTVGWLAMTDSFSVQFEPGAEPHRHYSHIIDLVVWGGFEGAQVLALPGEDFGARFVYGAPYPTTGVPEGGSTLALALVAAGALVELRRRMSR